jgi:hypothetical protein
MQRRKFLKHTLITSAGILTAPLISRAGWFAAGGTGVSTAQEIEKYFVNAPDAARPWVFWQWMNGNITEDGITLDLEAMKRMGIGGAIVFNAATGIIRGPVDYASEAWIQATVHAAKEAGRLGLEIAIHNSPGYSGCGGPWVTPEMSMQELVWTETLVQHTETANLLLKRPYAKQGYYRDAFVIAYPALAAEQVLMKDVLLKISFNGTEVDKDILTDGNPETKIRLTAAGTQKGIALFEFSQAFEARAVSILRKAEIPHDLFDGPRDQPPVLQIESSNDNKNWKPAGTLSMPALREMDTPGILSFPAVKAIYFRLISSSDTWISDVQFHSGPRLGGWTGKTNYTGGSLAAETPAVTPAELIDPAAVIDISAKMDAAGHLKWKAPAGKWTILRLGHTTTGEEPAAHPDSGKGLEIDKLRKDALDFHFRVFLDPLLSKMKPYIGKGFKAITVDSWEAGKQSWTPALPKEFKERKKYDIIPWLPALTGRIVGSTEDTERFLWDVRKTHAALLSENFYGHYQQLCKARGLEFYAEPYGDGTFDSLQVAQHLDITMSEFWTRYIYGSDVTSKQAAAAAHVYGKKIVAAEAFTAMPATSKWTDYPYSLKAEGDYFFTLGVNRLVFHTFVHQPYTTAKPGMTMGPFGMHMDRNNSWAEQSCGWTAYVKRSQYLLQQGLTVADACYLKGDEPASGVPDTYQFMPDGYVADVIGPDGLNRCSVKDQVIVLPDGMSYRVCILAELKQLLPTTLTKLKELVADGMILVVANKPLRSYGHEYTDEQLVKSVNELYGDLDGRNVTEVSYGKGKVIWRAPVSAIFDSLSVAPDFRYTAENPDATIHYIHKKLADMEYYFVSNHRRRHEKAYCSFRIKDLQPEIWNAETGEMYPAAVYEQAENRTAVSLELEPAGSLFIVFRHRRKSLYAAILKEGKTVYPFNFNRAKADPFPGIQNNFSISLWAKPDTFAHGGRSMLFHPPEGEAVYGAGHAAVGLAAGQNGVFLYERTKGTAKQVLASGLPLAGWSHLVLVYRNGNPAVYIDGRLAAEGIGSGRIIHPGLHTPPAVNQFSSYFEGEHTPPKLYTEVLTAEKIKGIYLAGLPAPELPEGIAVKQHTAAGHPEALIWSNGKYTLQNQQGKSIHITAGDCRTAIVSTPWKVKFPVESGVAAVITLPKLISLRLHPDFDVQHFSGTATYMNQLTLTKKDMAKGCRLYLDLGRVEVLAEVTVNGKSLGQVWKTPYRIDMSEVLKIGLNDVEIRVTTLWANRLIGDEYLPVENPYSEHGFIEQFPEWYTKNQPKPGKRKTFAVWKNFKATDPLLESGLLGPVRLITAVHQILSS